MEIYLFANLLAIHAELEAFQLENKNPRRLFNGDALRGSHFARLLGADVLILSL